MKENPKDTTGYPVIMFGTDASVFDPKSDSALRMQEYTKLHSHVHIITSARDSQGRFVIPLSEKVSVYPSKNSIKLVALLGMYRRARSVMREYGVRCVMSQDPFALGLVAYLLAREFRGAFSVGIYGMDINDLFFRRESIVQRLQMLIAPFVMRHADAIQTDGPETIEPLQRRYGEKIFFKPMFPSNTHDLENIERVIPVAPLRVLFIGRFSLQKNPDLLAQVIVSSAREFGEKIHFTLVGAGVLKAGLLETIRIHGVEKNITDAGTLSREQIVVMYSMHHLLILTSYDEGFPRVFMEAAIAGMPVITTAVGGVKDLIIDGKSGFVLPQGSTAEDFVKRIRTLAEDRELLDSFSKEIRRTWDEHYGGKTVLDYQKPLAEFLGERLTSVQFAVQAR